METFMAFKFSARRYFGFYDVLWLTLFFGSFQTMAGTITPHKIQNGGALEILKL